MLYSLSAQNMAGDVLTLILDDVSDGYVLKDVDGLDPVKATITSSKFAQVDGTQFQAAQLENRNIVIKIGLEPVGLDKDVEDLRWDLYNFFLPKSQVTLTLVNTKGLTTTISGRVESMEARLFVKEPQADISIICFDPDFVDTTTVTLDGETVSDSTTQVISYPGTEAVGFTISLAIDRSVTELTIYMQGPDTVVRQLDFAAAMVAGDVLTISTVPGSKGATLVRSGVASSVLYGVSPQSTYVALTKGNNNFSVYTEGAAIDWTMTYTPRYGGL